MLWLGKSCMDNYWVWESKICFEYSEKQIGFSHRNLCNLHLLSNSSPTKTWLSTRNRIFSSTSIPLWWWRFSSESKEPRFRLLEIEANAVIYIRNFSNEPGSGNRVRSFAATSSYLNIECLWTRCATYADCRLADYITSCYLYEYILYIPILIPIPMYLYLYRPSASLANRRSSLANPSASLQVCSLHLSHTALKMTKRILWSQCLYRL